MRMLKLPDGRIRLLVQGLARARIDSSSPTSRTCKAKITRLEEPRSTEELPPEHEALLRSVKQNLEKSVSLGKNISPEVMVIAANLDDPAPALGPRRVEPGPEARGRAEDPRVHRPDRAAAAGQRQPRQGDHRPDDAAGDLLPGARRDGQVAARVLPAPAARGRSSTSSARARRSPRSSTRTARSIAEKQIPAEAATEIEKADQAARARATPTPPRRRSSAPTSTG